MLRIKELREEQGLTQQGLAGMSGLSIRTISNAEAGKDPNVRTLRAIAQALGVSVDQLFVEESVS